MSRDGGSSGLPDTLTELMHAGPDGYDPDAVDTVHARAAELTYSGEDGRCPYTDEQRILDVRDPDAIVLGYSTTHRIGGQEEMSVAGRDDPDGYAAALDMIDAARDPDQGGDVPVYLPEDTRELLYRNMPGDRQQLGLFLDALAEITEPLPIEQYREALTLDGSSTGKTGAEQVAAVAASEEIDGDPVIATYNSGLRDFAPMVSVTPAAPWQILEGIELSEGWYLTETANRVHAIVERFTDPTEYRGDVEEIPNDLRGDLPRDVDVVVPDHSVTTEIGRQRRRWNEYGKPVPTYRQAVHGIDAALAADDVTTALPANAGPRINDDIGGRPGDAVQEELEAVTRPLELDYGADFTATTGVVDGAEEHDQAIGAAAIELSEGTPVVMTFDDHFVDMDGVVARDPASVGDALRAHR